MVVTEVFMPRWNLLLPFLTTTQCLIAQAPGAVAMVMDLSGKVLLGEGAKAEVVAITVEVPPGRMLRLEAGGRVVLVSFRTGEEITVKGPAAFTLDAEGRPVGLKQGVQRTQVQGLQLKQVLKPGGLAQASVVMREVAGQEAFRLLSPETKVVLSPTPTFYWTSVGAGAQYGLSLVNPDGTEHFRADTEDTSLALPAGNALREDLTYRWTVQATLADGSSKATRGEVEVLGAEQQRNLASLRSQRTQSFARHVTYAVALQSLGLTREAKAEWRFLSNKRPNDPMLKAYSE